MSTELIEQVVSGLHPNDQNRFNQLVLELMEHDMDEDEAKREAYAELFGGGHNKPKNDFVAMNYSKSAMVSDDMPEDEQ